MPSFPDRGGNAPPIVVGDPKTRTGSAAESEPVLLVIDGAVQGNKNLYGGDYYARFTATNWNGASVKLQARDANNVTMYDVATPANVAFSATANVTQGFGFGRNAEVTAVITGNPTGLYVSLSAAN